jgi:tetratricopeptide (TPR) repeat protein
MLQSDSPLPAPWRWDLSNAFWPAAGLLLGLFLVARPLAFQFEPYSGEAALAGLAALLFAVFAWGLGTAWAERRAHLSTGLAMALALWLGVVLLGLLRSPHPGAAVARATEAAVYVLLLLAAHALARAEPRTGMLLCRALVAVGAFEAFWGGWMKHVSLPRTRAEIATGQQLLPDILSGDFGAGWLKSESIFATFGNANSFGGFMALTILLQLGLWWDAERRRGAPAAEWSRRLCGWGGNAALLALQLYGLYISRSKGAWLALAAGVWFLLLQRPPASPVSPLAKWLKRLTAGAIAVLAAALAFGAATWSGTGSTAIPGSREDAAASHSVYGESLEVRFGYWQAAAGMVRENPALGVGLCGYGEAFPQYKPPWAIDAREAHNDWWQFWAELGIFGPLSWGLLWFLLLRRGKPVEAHATDQAAQDEGAGWAARFQWALAGGVVFGFILFYAAFGSLASTDLMNLFSGSPSSDPGKVCSGTQAPSGVAAGAFAALAAPLCLLLVFLAPALLSKRISGEAVPAPGGPAVWGAKAAVGAVLIHQLVDFDFTAQTLMSALFLLGGMIAALTEPAAAESLAPKDLRRLRPAFVLLAALLLPTAVLIPLFSGLPRKVAENCEMEAQRAEALLHQADDMEVKAKAAELLTQSREDEAMMREEAFGFAPFDGQAAFDLANAYARLERDRRRAWTPKRGPRVETPLTELIQECLEGTLRLRPRWAMAHLNLGHHAAHSGLREMDRRNKEAAARRFAEAEARYAEAAWRAPQTPMLPLLRGDALLFQGRVGAAAEAYQEAWECDARIVDRNTRFDVLFRDPRPACLTLSHGCDPRVLNLLDESLAGLAADSPLRKGLLVRRILGAAWQRW